jgi:hypothetical protein
LGNARFGASFGYVAGGGPAFTGPIDVPAGKGHKWSDESAPQEERRKKEQKPSGEGGQDD